MLTNQLSKAGANKTVPKASGAPIRTVPEMGSLPSTVDLAEITALSIVSAVTIRRWPASVSTYPLFLLWKSSHHWGTSFTGMTATLQVGDWASKGSAAETPVDDAATPVLAGSRARAD
jgi:hypothetical protein